jgi:acetylcholinesterase
VIYVSANYRLNGQSRLSRSFQTTHPLRDEAFGFLPGKEAKAAGLGNIGLRDRESAVVVRVFYNLILLEQFALRWVQKHISAFGGDPTKVITYVTNFRHLFEC